MAPSLVYRLISCARNHLGAVPCAHSLVLGVLGASDAEAEGGVAALLAARAANYTSATAESVAQYLDSFF